MNPIIHGVLCNVQLVKSVAVLTQMTLGKRSVNAMNLCLEHKNKIAFTAKNSIFGVQPEKAESKKTL